MAGSSYSPRVRVRRSLLAIPFLLSSLVACGRAGSTPDLHLDSAPTGAPQVVLLDPPDGAIDVDPARGALSVTFDREMDREGWAWVIETPATAPELGASTWDPAERTNTVVAKLEPGRTYVLWINSPQFAYFKDRVGVPATPRRWSFSTSGLPREAAAASTPAAHPPNAPRALSLEPPDGATGVDPALTLLEVSFDREMSEGWSWVIETRENFPQIAGDASMSADRRNAFLPVRLAPGRTYVVWLNSVTFQDFRDTAGRPLPPLRWTFTTSAPSSPPNGVF